MQNCGIACGDVFLFLPHPIASPGEKLSVSKKFRVGADAHIGPLRNVRFSVEKSVKSIDFTDGPMWASAPTNYPKEVL